MRSDKGEAFVLRRAGKSYSQIASELGVAKSTLSSWFKGVDFSEAIKKELVKAATKKGAVHLKKLNRVRGDALSVHYELAQKEALKEMSLYRNVPLFTTGLGIYWSNGNLHNKHQIRISSSDPKVLKVFIAFLQNFVGVETQRIKLAIFLYPDLDDAKCRRYWKKQLGFKEFNKSQQLPKREKTKKIKHGICQVVVSSAYHKKKLDVWIDQLPEMVLNTVPKTRNKQKRL